MQRSKYIISLGIILLVTTSCARKGEATLTITSPAFTNNQPIPAKYSCQGDDMNPPLDISGIPERTKSMVLIVDDPDAPMGTWIHWVVYNIPPETANIAEHSIPGAQGDNSFQQNDFGGPCPPSGSHRYFFKIYALDTLLVPTGKMTKSDVENLMKNHILAKAQLVGTYRKTF